MDGHADEASRAQVEPFPLSELAPWLLFAVVLLALLYVVGVEQGAASPTPGRWVHEMAHDGRHLLGFPCH